MILIPKTAHQYGLEMKSLGLKAPAPTLDRENIERLAFEAQFFRVGRRSLKNVFVLVRKGYGTMYVRPSYKCYRLAYKAVFPDSLTGRDVDHLSPRSKASTHQYLALGHIDARINRLHKDASQLGNLVMKGMSQDNSSLSVLTSTPRARELGRFVQNGYIRAMIEINESTLTQVTVADF